jgi:branched-chain amino acid transport system ATP-binding protein
MITISGLRAGYGKLEVLHDITLTIPENQFTAILGPNGSGKSTLLKSLMGLTDILGGSAKMKGVELLGIRPESMIQHGIAYVPQRGNVFTSMSVYENLQLAVRRLRRADAHRAINEAYTVFPILEKRTHQRAEHLSGGERQMLAIALAWLSRPRLMLLDEPSAGLSPLVTHEMFDLLKTLNERGMTLVVVEQNARTILRWCSYVFVLREGRLVFEGTAEECRANEEMVKTYLSVGGKQFTPKA